MFTVATEEEGHDDFFFLFFLMDLSGSWVELTSPALAGRFFTTEPPGKSIFSNKLLQLLCIFELNTVT